MTKEMNEDAQFTHEMILSFSMSIEKKNKG